MLSQDRGGLFRALEESVATGLWRAKQRETYTNDWCQLALPSLWRSSVGACGAGCWGSGFGHQILGRGLGLAAQRQPEGAKVWCATTKGVWEEAWAHQRGKVPLLGASQPTRVMGAGARRCCLLGFQRKMQTRPLSPPRVLWVSAGHCPTFSGVFVAHQCQESCNLAPTTAPTTQGFLAWPAATAKGHVTWCPLLHLPPHEYMQPAASANGPATWSQPLHPPSWECVHWPCTCTYPIKGITVSTPWGKR